ncbi:MAG: hypothetical protein FJY83_02125 [Candidatus Aminicenantes bacterium]|nr:hypothetical protein [Candidatus Aminicenantes bacterium]
MTYKTMPIFLACALLMAAAAPAIFAAQAESPELRAPVLLTSCGQSPGADMLKVILKRLNLEFELKPLAAAGDLKAGTATGAPYRSLVVVMGASLKGMGAAGIAIDDEIKRIAALIGEARHLGVPVVGAHIEGLKRRSQGASAGDTTDEQTIDAVAPRSDLLLVNRDGNADKRFTAVAEAKKIPLVEVEKNLDLLVALDKLFKK